MKNIFYVLLMVILFHSCAKEATVYQNEEPVTVKVSEKRAEANKHYIETSKKSRDKYRLTEGVEPHPKLLHIYRQLNQDAMEGTWENVHQIAQKGLKPVLGDNEYVFDIQTISYKVLHQKLLLESQGSDELNEAILFYFTELMNTKAEDLGVLTQTLQRIEKHLEPDDLAIYKNYLLSRADKDLVRYEPLLEEQKSKLNSNNDDDYTIRRHIVAYQQRIDDAKLVIVTFKNS